jgi:hypothetical protein
MGAFGDRDAENAIKGKPEVDYSRLEPGGERDAGFFSLAGLGLT